jgi:hypothetical protein
MNVDQPHRKFRYVEVLYTNDLKRSRTGPWHLVEGWLDLAENLSPGSPKALLEGDCVAQLPDQSIFKEVSFKAAHGSVEEALESWASTVGRRWARISGGLFVRSDYVSIPIEQIRFETNDRAAGATWPAGH